VTHVDTSRTNGVTHVDKSCGICDIPSVASVDNRCDSCRQVMCHVSHVTHVDTSRTNEANHRCMDESMNDPRTKDVTYVDKSCVMSLM